MTDTELEEVDVLFEGEVGVRRSKRVDVRYAILTSDALELFATAEGAQAMDEGALRGTVAREDAKSVEVEGDFVTILVGDQRLSLMASVAEREDFLTALWSWVPDGPRRKSHPAVRMCGYLSIMGKAAKYFVLTAETFVAFESEEEASDESAIPIIEIAIHMVNRFEGTEEGFLLQLGHEDPVAFEVPQPEKHEAWVVAWETIDDPDLEKLESAWSAEGAAQIKRMVSQLTLPSNRSGAFQAQASEEAEEARAAGAEEARVAEEAARAAAAEADARARAEEEEEEAAARARAEEEAARRQAEEEAARREAEKEAAGDVDEEEKETDEAEAEEKVAIGYFDITFSTSTDKGVARRYFVELFEGVVHFFRGEFVTDEATRPPDTVIEVASVRGLDVLDDGFLLKLTSRETIRMQGPSGGDDVDTWLDGLERVLLPGKPSTPDFGSAGRNAALDAVMPPVLMPLMAGTLHVLLPSEQQWVPRQVTLEETGLQIFADLKGAYRGHSPLAEVEVGALDSLQLLDNQFELGALDGSVYRFRARDGSDLMVWVRSWRSVLEPDLAPATYEYMRAEAPVHEGPVRLDGFGGTQARYARVYPSRAEFFERADRVGPRAPRRILWPQDVQGLTVTDEGFAVAFRQGPVEVDIAEERAVQTWVDAFRSMLRPFGEPDAPESAGGEPDAPPGSAAPPPLVVAEARRRPPGPRSDMATVLENEESEQVEAWIGAMAEGERPLCLGALAMPVPGGGPQPRFAALFRDRLDLWRDGARAAGGAPAARSLAVGDIARVDVDTAAGSFTLTCIGRGAVEGDVGAAAAALRRFHVSDTSELHVWCLAILGAMSPQADGAKPPRPRSAGAIPPSPPPKPAKHPRNWLPRVAKLQPKPPGAKDEEGNGRCVEFRERPRGGDRAFIVAAPPEVLGAGGGWPRREAEAKPAMSQRCPSAPPARRRLDDEVTTKVTGDERFDRFPAARGRQADWSKITLARDGSAAPAARKRWAGSRTQKPTDAGREVNGWALRPPRCAPGPDKLKDMSGARLWYPAFA